MKRKDCKRNQKNWVGNIAILRYKSSSGVPYADELLEKAVRSTALNDTIYHST
jgi:hypothetical protein